VVFGRLANQIKTDSSQYIRTVFEEGKNQYGRENSLDIKYSRTRKDMKN
jgi:hypothetical protein